jgi:tetratricopeptide (TPR) repeat protein
MLLYYKAVADPKKPDEAMLKEARQVVERGLTTAIKPKESFYQLLLALQQQQNDLAGSAEILELLLKQNPNKKDQWQMLMALYLQLSEKAREKDPTLAREYLVRAIVTAERAQALNFLNTPKDNMTLVSLYLMANQFTKGTELLYNGMKKGTIESEPHNWRILGRYYQEADMNDRAIAVLKEATALFPKNGELEVQIAQIYVQMEKSKEAFQHAKAAVAKGNFSENTKPYSVYYLIAYTAYELGMMEEAHKALLEAGKFEESKKDTQFARLKEVVAESLAAKEAEKKPKDDKSQDEPEAKKGAPKVQKSASNR